MSNIDSRIEKLEKQTGAKEPERKTWVLVKGEPKPEGIGEKDQVIEVVSERAKELTAHIIAGKEGVIVQP